MPLYISMTTPGQVRDKSPIEDAITFLASLVAMEARNGSLPHGGPILDVTFMLSAGEDRPAFKGMRMGGFTPENNTLFFEAAVPENMTQSVYASRYVTAVLQDVVDHAGQYCSEHSIEFAAQQWTDAVRQIVEPDSSQQVSVH